jgi:hypothetical protein
LILEKTKSPLLTEKCGTNIHANEISRAQNAIRFVSIYESSMNESVQLKSKSEKTQQDLFQQQKQPRIND